MKTKVVVVGGGFAGIRVVRGLAEASNIEVTLISNKPDFRYSPALYRTATGRRKRESFIPLASLVAGISNVHLVQATASKIDRPTKTITTHDGTEYRYDYCVLALGVVTNYFGIPGLDEYSYGIKSAQEIIKLKHHLHSELINTHAMDQNYVIVGGGPTGVELAAELGNYLKRIARAHRVRRSKVSLELIEAAPRLLPTLSPRASRLARSRLRSLKVRVMTGKHVNGETSTTLKVDDRPIPTHTVIWTAGMSNSQFFTHNATQFSFDPKKRVAVDQYLQVDPHVFVAGDNAATKYGGLALSAVHNAAAISKNIRRLSSGKKARAYKPLKPISAVPLGNNRAIIQYGPVTFDGVIGGMIRRIADLVGYADIMGYVPALKLWMKKESYEETCKICRSPQVSTQTSD